MKRTPMPPRRSWLQRRTPLARVSRKRRRADREHDAIRQAVFARDGGCVLRTFAPLGPVPECSGTLTYHHRRKASAGGSYSMANGLTLCAGHNTWVEDAPRTARLIWPTLVVREGDPEWHELARNEREEVA